MGGRADLITPTADLEEAEANLANLAGIEIRQPRIIGAIAAPFPPLGRVVDQAPRAVYGMCLASSLVNKLSTTDQAEESRRLRGSHCLV